jgi:type II secretory pathway pseudopilin PulG
MRGRFFSLRRRQGSFYRLRSAAFSLIEVVLAIGVASFGVLAVVALLPAGIKSAKDSLEETSALDIVSEVVADRQASPLQQVSRVYSLPALTNTLTVPVTNYFGITDANQMSTQLNQARYRIDYVVYPPANGTLDPYQIWLKVSWPAQSANPTGFMEDIMTFPQL